MILVNKSILAKYGHSLFFSEILSLLYNYLYQDTRYEYHSYKAHQHKECFTWRIQVFGEDKLETKLQEKSYHWKVKGWEKKNHSLQYLQNPRTEINFSSGIWCWFDRYGWTHPFSDSSKSLIDCSLGSSITMEIQGFDGLSTCLFTESFVVWWASVVVEMLLPASVRSSSDENGSSWTGSILWLPRFLEENPRPVSKKLYECLSEAWP